MHGNGAGGNGGVFQNGIPVGIIPGNAVGFGKGNKTLVVGFHLIQQLFLQRVTSCLQSNDFRFHLGIALFANGEGTHHVAKCGTQGADQRGSTAAAGSGGIGRQNLHEGTAGFQSHIHKKRTPLYVVGEIAENWGLRAWPGLRRCRRKDLPEKAQAAFRLCFFVK